MRPYSARHLTVTAIALMLVLLLGIGTASHPVTAQGNSNTYVVQAGDDLFRIALKFHVSMGALANANGIVNPNFILVGQTLIIPVGNGPLSATAEATSASVLAATTEALAVPTAEATTAATMVATASSAEMPIPYTVQLHDTLYSISVRFHTTMFVLMQLNMLPNPNMIYVGEVLKLPASASAGITATVARAATQEATPSGN